VVVVVLGIVGGVGDAVDGVGTVVVLAASVVGTDAATGERGVWVAVTTLVRRPDADWLNPATNASTMTSAALVADRPQRWRDAPVRSLDA
jgi:hypothetical protein